MDSRRSLLSHRSCGHHELRLTLLTNGPSPVRWAEQHLVLCTESFTFLFLHFLMKIFFWHLQSKAPKTKKRDYIETVFENAHRCPPKLLSSLLLKGSFPLTQNQLVQEVPTKSQLSPAICPPITKSSSLGFPSLYSWGLLAASALCVSTDPGITFNSFIVECALARHHLLLRRKGQ